MDKIVKSLAALSEMIRQMNSATSEEDVFQIVATGTPRILEVDRVSVTLIDESDGTASISSLEGGKFSGRKFPTEGTLIGLAIQENRMVHTADISQSDKSDARGLAKQGLRAIINAPLITGGMTMGTLNVASKKLNGFDDLDEQLVLQISLSMASNIESRRLFEKTIAALAETEEYSRSLALMSQKMNLATSENEVFRTAALYTPDILNVGRASIALADQSGEMLEVVSLQGKEGAIPLGKKLPIAGTLVGIAIRENRLVYTPDANQSDTLDAKVLSEQGFLSIMNAPLTASGQVIGSLNVAVDKANRFTERDKHLLLQVASLLATNLESRRLFEKTQASLVEAKDYANRLTVLNEMSRQLSLAGDETEVYNTAIRYITRIIPADRVSMALLLEPADRVEVYSLSGVEGAMPVGKQLPLDNTNIGEAIRTRRTFNIPSFENSDTIDSKVLLEQGLHSGLSAPMLVGDKTLGTLNIAGTKDDAFNVRDENLILQIALILAANINNRQLFSQTQSALRETNRLLLNILPEPIAERLKSGEEVIADGYSEATILFADIVGFTKIAKEVTPIELLEYLNQVFSTFDQLTEKYGLEKIKTIGDAYMVVSGLPTPSDNHAVSMASLAISMLEAMPDLNKKFSQSLSIRIGMHTGSVVAGVIGKKKFAYDIWGDAVNTASRMESHGIPGEIQTTAETYRLLKNQFQFEERGMIDIKGRGSLQTYFLKSRTP